jgi:hypothetical protein
MSVQSEMDRIRSNVQSALGVIADTGVEVPAGANSDALPDAARALANAKQDKLTGKQGQIVSFGADGNAKAEDAPFLPAENGENGSLILNDVYLNGNSVKEVNQLEVADLKIMNVAGGTPVARIMASTGMVDFQSIDLQVGLTPKGIYSAANKGYVDGLAAHQATVTLTAAGWASKAQTVSVAGILKDQTKQVVDVAPADTASRDAWAKAGIWCTDPTADGKLTFTCDTVPTVAVNVRVRWQGVAV